jgi:hypothetical protein
MTIMDWEFIHEEIEVEFEKKPGPPVSFTWRDEKFLIAEVLQMWADYSFGTLKYRPRWWQRRHRNCYRVRTDKGEIVEFYLDRSAGKWVLYRRAKTAGQNSDWK